MLRVSHFPKFRIWHWHATVSHFHLWEKRQDKHLHYKINSSLKYRLTMGNSTVLDYIQSELLPISPDGAQTPLKCLLGTIISHLICPDGGKGSSGQITVQVWLGFPLSKPQLKQAYGQCEHGHKPCGWLTFWDSGRVMEMTLAGSKRIWSKSQMRNVSSVKMFPTS